MGKARALAIQYTQLRFPQRLLGWTLVPMGLLVAAAFWRVTWFQGGDSYAGLRCLYTFICGVVLMIVVVIDSHNNKVRDVYDKGDRWICRGLVVVCLVLGTYFAQTGYRYLESNDDGVWVVPQVGGTTVANQYLRLPTGKVPGFFVSNLLSISATVSLQTVDKVPISCFIRAHGVNLDKRDTKRLEGVLLGIAVTRNPEKYLESQVISQLSTAASAVFAVRSSKEIGPQDRLLIRHEIGTPIGDTLAANALRWVGGDIFYSCELKKFQS